MKPFIFFVALYLSFVWIRAFAKHWSGKFILVLYIYTFPGKSKQHNFCVLSAKKNKGIFVHQNLLSCAQAQNTCARLNKSPKKKRLIKANEEFLCKLVRFLHRESRECKNFNLPCGFWVPNHNVSIWSYGYSPFPWIEIKDLSCICAGNCHESVFIHFAAVL